MIERPMLCTRLVCPELLRFPLLATPKVDGVRALRVGNAALTRRWKPVQNLHTNRLLLSLPEGVDGELLHPDGFAATQSAAMRRAGEPELYYYIFDWAQDPSAPYRLRAYSLTERTWPSWVKLMVPVLVHSVAEFLAYEEKCLAAGFEGVVARTVDSPYVGGRSPYMVKWKRFDDGEAVVLGIVEQMRNCNPVQRNIFGYAKRPGGRGLKVPKGTMGSIEVRDVRTGVLFEVGSGFDDELRQRVWNSPSDYIGRVLTYKHQGSVKDRPRFPVFKGWREDV